MLSEAIQVLERLKAAITVEQAGIVIGVMGVAASAYAYWKPRQIRLTATADIIISLSTNESPFQVTIVNAGTRQARISYISFEIPRLHEVAYAAELFNIPLEPMTDGAVMRVRVDANRIMKDLAQGADYSRGGKILPGTFSELRAWVETSTGARFSIDLSPDLKRKFAQKLAMQA